MAYRSFMPAADKDFGLLLSIHRVKYLYCQVCMFFFLFLLLLLKDE